MGNGVIDEDLLEKYYCPCCGKSFAEHIDGELINPCERCKTRLRIMVSWPLFIIIGIRTRKNKHNR